MAAYRALGGGVAVVKAQIHAGGRGKGGGVKLVQERSGARAAAAKAILGKPLVTHQTGPHGQRRASACSVEQGSRRSRKEHYVGIAIDREQQRPVMMASSEGGVEIEEVAAERPEKILKAAVLCPTRASRPADARAARRAGSASRRRCAPQARRVPGGAGEGLRRARLLARRDQPAGRDRATGDGAGARRQDQLRLERALPPPGPARAARPERGGRRTRSRPPKHELTYIALDGNIGCMVNGAGLAMATMDVIKLYGGAPANFLDVGGGATTEKVDGGLRHPALGPEVEGRAGQHLRRHHEVRRDRRGRDRGGEAACTSNVPLSCASRARTSRQGRELLEGSGLPIITATDLDDAAKQVCAAARGSRSDEHLRRQARRA